MKRPGVFAFIVLLASCTTLNKTSQHSEKISIELPEFDEDKWVSLEKDINCVSYMYEGEVATDGSVRHWQLLYASDPIFQFATEASLNTWKIEDAKSNKVYADIFYNREGRAQVVFPNVQDVPNLIEARKKYGRALLKSQSTTSEVKDNVSSQSEEAKTLVEYPREAHIKGIQGYVLSRYDIDDQGKRTNIRFLAESPKGVFAEEIAKMYTKLSPKLDKAGKKDLESQHWFSFADSKIEGCYLLYHLERRIFDNKVVPF